jgi:hypothetical protein
MSVEARFDGDSPAELFGLLGPQEIGVDVERSTRLQDRGVDGCRMDIE